MFSNPHETSWLSSSKVKNFFKLRPTPTNKVIVFTVRNDLLQFAKRKVETAAKGVIFLIASKPITEFLNLITTTQPLKKSCASSKRGGVKNESQRR